MKFDLFCLALIALFALFGLFRGLLRQIFGVIGFIGGVVLSRMFAGTFGQAFAQDLGLPEAVATAGLAIAIFIAVEILAKLLGGFLHKRIEGGFTGATNRFGGFFMGAAKGLLIAWAVASMVALLRPHLRNVEAEAKKADIAHSKAIAVATEVNLITELRAGR